MEQWMLDDLVKDIPRQKLEFLSSLMNRKAGNDPKEVMRQMLPLIKEAKENGLQFTPSEVSAAIAAIRKYSDSSENSRIDEILRKANYGNGKSNH